MKIFLNSFTNVPEYDDQYFEDNKDLYLPLIKKNCVACANDLPGTWEYYKLRGNFCLHCLGEVRNNLEFAPRVSNKARLLGTVHDRSLKHKKLST